LSRSSLINAMTSDSKAPLYTGEQSEESVGTRVQVGVDDWDGILVIVDVGVPDGVADGVAETGLV
jgi:hypothetical protein